MVSVVEMVPLMSVACARAPQTRKANTEKTESVIRLERIWLIGPPYAVLKVAIGTTGGERRGICGSLGERSELVKQELRPSGLPTVTFDRRTFQNTWPHIPYKRRCG